MYLVRMLQPLLWTILASSATPLVPAQQSQPTSRPTTETPQEPQARPTAPNLEQLLAAAPSPEHHAAFLLHLRDADTTTPATRNLATTHLRRIGLAALPSLIRHNPTDASDLVQHIASDSTTEIHRLGLSLRESNSSALNTSLARLQQIANLAAASARSFEAVFRDNRRARSDTAELLGHYAPAAVELINALSLAVLKQHPTVAPLAADSLHRVGNSVIALFRHVIGYVTPEANDVDLSLAGALLPTLVATVLLRTNPCLVTAIACDDPLTSQRATEAYISFGSANFPDMDTMIYLAGTAEPRGRAASIAAFRAMCAVSPEDAAAYIQLMESLANNQDLHIRLKTTIERQQTLPLFGAKIKWLIAPSDRNDQLAPQSAPGGTSRNALPTLSLLDLDAVTRGVRPELLAQIPELLTRLTPAFLTSLGSDSWEDTVEDHWDRYARILRKPNLESYGKPSVATKQLFKLLAEAFRDSAAKGVLFLTAAYKTGLSDPLLESECAATLVRATIYLAHLAHGR